MKKLFSSKLLYSTLGIILGLTLIVQLLLLFPLCKCVRADILCVDKTGQSFDPNCATCYTKIMQAIMSAHDGDAIIVNKGVYEENIDYWGKAVTIRSIDPDDPDVIAATRITGSGSKSPVVYFGNGEGYDSVISGFTITNKIQIGNGTGIYCSNCSPTISNCNIRDNTAGISGGGVYCIAFAKPKLDNCSIIGNTAQDGGGIFSDKDSLPSLSHCIVENNSASVRGGGICFLSSSPEISDTTIKGNSAPNGAGIYLGSSSQALIRDCAIRSNNATTSGGGICLASSTIEIYGSAINGNSANMGAGLYCNESSLLNIDNSFINHNNANANGGALYCASSSITVSKTAFEGNKAVSSGGAVYSDHSDLELIDVCSIKGNSAVKGAGFYCDNSTTLYMGKGMITANSSSDNGGGVYCNSSSVTFDGLDINGNYSGSSGGGIYINNSSSSLAILNSVLSKNIAKYGAGLYLNSPNIAVSHCTIGTNTAYVNGGGIFCNNSSQEIKITNSLLWENIPQQIYGGNPSVTFSDIQGEYSGEGNINADPLFMDEDTGNYYLNPGSPCIDTSDPNSPVAFDKEGIQRPHDGNGDDEAISDMGAYEYILTDSCTPRASFSVDKKTGYSPLTVIFDASSSGGSAYDDPNDPYDDYDPNAFRWDFGDGSTGTGINPEHTYEAYGLFDVSLSIKTKCGSHTSTLHEYILVFSSNPTKEVGTEGYPYDSIKSAIDEAEDGETILAHDGTYNESIDFGERLIVIRSENGPENTIIDGSGGSNVVTFSYGRHNRFIQRIEGFTIQNGSGAGIYLVTSSPEIDNCIIKENAGSGVYSYFSYPYITNCMIRDNKSSSSGGGIYAYYSIIHVCDSMVSHNTSVYDGGGVCSEKSSVILERCDINRNISNRNGGGIYSNASYGEILHSYIKDNSAGSYGGGIHESSSLMFNIINSVVNGNKGRYGGGVYSNSNRLKVVHSTISKNISEQGGAIYCYQNTKDIAIRNSIIWDNFYDQIYNGSNLTVTYSDIQGGFGDPNITHNINEDPLFIESTVGALYPDPNSPCIDAGDPNDPITDDIGGKERPQGQGVDMGAYEYFSPGYCAPQPSFTADKIRGTAPLTVRFDASLSVGNRPYVEDDPNGGYDPDAFEWDFGDGNTGTGINPEHTYIEYGVYSVSLTITPGCGPDAAAPLNIKAYDLICVKSASPTREVGIGSEFAYNSIQAAIDAAKDGEVILVHDGTYYEKVDFKGKRIALYSENGADLTIIDPGDNTGNIVTFSSNETIDSVLDGFTIQKSKNTGIYCNLSAPFIKNCLIKNNASNGIYAYLTPPENSPVIEGCDVIGNTRGILCSYTSPDIMGCNIKGNSISGNGGGIYCNRFSGTIKDCEVTGNSASSNGGGIYFYYSSGDIRDCMITTNTASYGGGIRFDNSSGDIRDCVITTNTASNNGGGIYFYASSGDIWDCTIKANTASYGGGIFFDSSNSILTNCLITENIAQSSGGGIYTHYSNSKIVNSTFSGNIAANGGGIYHYSYYSTNYGAKISNSIFWDDFPNEIIAAYYASCITANYSDIMGGYPGEGNIDADPLFIDSDKGNYYILPFSPCVDKVDPDKGPSEDIVGTKRPQRGMTDMGAYENISASSCIPRAVFTASPGSGRAPLYVEFDASLSGGAMCPNAEILWEFGDGSTGEGIFVTHTYTEYGVYGATLRIIIDQDPNDISEDPNTSYFSEMTQEIYVASSEPTKEVGPGDDYDYDSIQTAIDDADEGELIRVHDGTYYEKIDFKGKRITLISKNGPEETIIDGGANGSVVQFINYEGRDSVIDGFTIQKGSASRGGGIYCNIASPVIRNCIIRGNYGSEHGGGFYCLGGSPHIINCKIKYNTAGSNGGGICFYSSRPGMTNCLLFKNRCGDKGGAIYHEDSDPVITNCTITENLAYNSGGGIHSDNSSPFVTNSILWGDFPNEIAKTGTVVVPEVTYSIIEGYDGYGDPNLSNIDTDPLFIDSKREDYYLDKVSPCINSGTAEFAPDQDIDGTSRQEVPGIDRGAYEYVPFASCRPRAFFTADTIRGTGTLEVYFDASSSGGLGCMDPDDPNSIVWAFGDGNTGSGIIVSHTYTGYGFYDVSLTVTTTDGSSHTLKRRGYIRVMASGPTKEVGEQGVAYDSIQTAIDEAGNGEMILVHDGIYHENLNLKGKGIILVSENGPESTMIDGSGTGSAVRIENYEGEDTLLEGFTIRNGSASNGGGIYIYLSSPVINNCIIKENFAEYGGGIYLLSGAPRINNSRLSLNRSTQNGGGIRYIYSSPVLTGCIIERNQSGTGGGICAIRSFFPEISGCIISNNSATSNAGGIYEESRNLTITKCTISSNVSTSNGGGVYFPNSSGSIVNTVISKNVANSGGGIFISSTPLDILNCTITQNRANSGSGIYCNSSSPAVNVKDSVLWDSSPGEIRQQGSNPQVTYSCIMGGYTGEGNIKDDPGFMDPDTEDYYLKGFSPCINAGDNTDAPIDDREGIKRVQTVDMGAYEYIPDISCDPRAVFTPYHTSGDTPLTVIFDASYSGGGQLSDPNNFVWSFGDGDSEKGVIVSHTYENHGAYTVSLTVSNTCSDSPHTLTVPDCVKVKASYPTREVGKGDSYAHNSIQSAIDAAEDWERIVVYSGTYYERINFRGKRVTLVSSAGKDATTIDGTRNGSVVTFGFNEDVYSVLDGFTVYNGYAGYGGGIYSYLASPLITNCSIKGNYWGDYGGGVYCSWASPYITSSTIENNLSNRGGGIYLNYSLATIAKCIISGNTAYYYGGGIYSVNSSPDIINCLIFGNKIYYYNIGGIHLYNAFTTKPTNITNCTISDNISNSSPGGIYLYNNSPIITNSIIYFNSPDEFYREGNSNPVITYSDIKGGYGDPNATHNIDADPLFVDREAGDYHLSLYSPCIDRGTDPNAPFVPSDDLEDNERPYPEGRRYDMGAYEYKYTDPNQFCYQDKDGDLYGDPNVFIQAITCPDGYINRSGDCADDEPDINPGATEACDGIDNDCSGVIDDPDKLEYSNYYKDRDTDGYGDPNDSRYECKEPEGYVLDGTDCDDSDIGINPGVAELCDDMDNNCDGDKDEGFNVGEACTVGEGACERAGKMVCTGDGMGSECDAVPGEPSAEICDGMDNDCNGDTDEGFSVGEACTAGVGACERSGKMVCTGDGLGTECDAVPGTPATEVCDDIDNDCNGVTDDPDKLEYSNYYKDQDTDGYGDPNDIIYDCREPEGYVLNNEDCNDIDPNSYPGAPEICGDNIDQDCDGKDCPFLLSLYKGWNLISVPMASEDMTRVNLFPDAEEVLYYDSNSKTDEYVDINDEMVPCMGYWVLAPETKGYVMGDIPITHYTSAADPNGLPLVKGWNRIGALSGLTSISVTNGEIDAVYEFSDGMDWGYKPADGFDFGAYGYLKQGTGYWVYQTEGAGLYGSIADPNVAGLNGADDSSPRGVQGGPFTDGWAGNIKAYGIWEEGCATSAIVTIGSYTRQIRVPAVPEPPCSTISLDLIDPNDFFVRNVKDIRSNDSGDSLAQAWVLLIENREDIDPNYCPLLTWDLPQDLNGSLELRRGQSGTGELLVEDMKSVTSYTMSPADGKELTIVWRGYGENYYRDSDQDGYGVSDDFKWLPGPQGDYTALAGGDPDDTDPSIFPRKLRIGIAEGYSGERDITLPIEIEDGLGITGIDITLRYDPGTITVKEIATTPFIQDFFSEYDIREWEGKINIVIASSTGILLDSGNFANMVVDISDEAQVGSVLPIRFERAFIYNENAGFCGAVTTDGGIRITDKYYLGDLNRDKWLTSADAVIILKIAVGSVTPDAYQLKSGDLNKDGLINSADAILVLKAAVEKPTVFCIQPDTGMPGTSVKIQGWNFETGQGDPVVYFGDIPSQPVSWENSDIITVVPSGLAQGVYEVTVNTFAGTSNISEFIVGDNTRSRFRDINYRAENEPAAKTVSIPAALSAVSCGSVAIPVDVDDAAGIAGMDIVLGFDASLLKPVKAECTTLTSKFLVMMADRGNGEAIISIARASGIHSGKGSLVTVTFEISSSARENGVIPLTIKNLGLYNEDARLIKGVAFTNGELIISGAGVCPEDNNETTSGSSSVYNHTYSTYNLSNFYYDFDYGYDYGYDYDYDYERNQALFYQENTWAFYPYNLYSNYFRPSPYSAFPLNSDYYPPYGYHGNSGDIGQNWYADVFALFPWWNNREIFYPYEYRLLSWLYYSRLH